jgi:ADP-heptose:LPS heptosyltransferase
MVFRSICVSGLDDDYLARYNWENTVPEVGASYRPPTLLLPPDSWKPEGFVLDSYLLLNPTAGWKSKRWKVGSWVTVLRRLLEHDPEMNVLITSGDQEWQMEHSQWIANDLGTRVHFWGGQTELEAFLWLISRSRMVLGVDGAASHLAAAFGRRSLKLFLKKTQMVRFGLI